MAAWQNSSSLRRMPTSESSPTATARGVEMLQEQQQGRKHSVAEMSHCVKSLHSQSMVQDVSGSPHTSTRSGGDGLKKSDATTPASPTTRIKTGTNKHGGGSGSDGKGGVPRRLILTQDHNHIHHPSPISLKESRRALLENDAMVYLDGPQVYTCANCRTHLTSHDDIISKSFHGRNGRAYLFDQCVNITTGQPEDRILITGLHTVSDISCKRCQTLVGWTYAKAYEPSQKYKEGKYIIEKIYLHMEESGYYTVDRPAGERGDKWQVRSMSWGSEESQRAASITSSTTSGSSWSVIMGGSYHHGASMNRMSSPTSLPGCGGFGGGTRLPYCSRDRCTSMARSSPQTPPTPHRQSSSSPGVLSTTTSITTTTTTPESPISPSISDIIYEYPNML